MQCACVLVLWGYFVLCDVNRQKRYMSYNQSIKKLIKLLSIHLYSLKGLLTMTILEVPVIPDSSSEIRSMMELAAIGTRIVGKNI